MTTHHECPDCNGYGSQLLGGGDDSGPSEDTIVCLTCKGSGEVVRPCDVCGTHHDVFADGHGNWVCQGCNEDAAEEAEAAE
jgi:DnaJ-class molecular chaperone